MLSFGSSRGSLFGPIHVCRPGGLLHWNLFRSTLSAQLLPENLFKFTFPRGLFVRFAFGKWMEVSEERRPLGLDGRVIK